MDCCLGTRGVREMERKGRVGGRKVRDAASSRKFLAALVLAPSFKERLVL
jgi:hypothetical protein